MAEIEYFAENRAFLRSNNSLWSVRDCLEFCLRETQKFPGRYPTAMVMFASFPPGNFPTYDRFTCGMDHLQQSALLDAVRHNMMKEAYP